MKSKLSSVVITVTVLLMLSHLFPYCLSDNYSDSYQLANHPGGSTFYRLNIVVSQALLDYYTQKSHRLYSNSDFAKFVTPYPLKPIADSLWQIYTDDEDYVNGVLMLVHQIPYEVTAPVKYPVETIAGNKGDCDLFSFIAASVMVAGGLDVVLFYYENEAHMNIGVNLSHTPHDARDQAFHITYGDSDYYVAECTGGNWQNGWRAGECPTDLKDAYTQVITLESSEEEAPGQVSASYNNLAPSALLLTVSSTYLVQGNLVTFSGQLSPVMQNRTITIYVRTDGAPWTILGAVTTDSKGQFVYAWNADVAGIDYFRASWSGNDYYAGADSQIQSVTVLSTFLVVLIGLTLSLVSIGAVVFLVSRRGQVGNLEPLPPEEATS